MLDSLRYDVKHAVRALRGASRTTAAALVILALAIGSVTALFSAVNHVLVRPLPFPDAERLLRVRDAVVGSDGQIHPFNMRARDVLLLGEYGQVFDGFVAFSGDSMTLVGGATPERLSVVHQTAGINATLAVAPALGRPFTADEERRGMDAGVAIIGHSLWQSRFGGLSSALGQTIGLNARRFTIVGVMPPLYAFPYEAQVWLPHALNAADQSRDFAVFVHVRPGADLGLVRARLAAVAALIRQRYPDAPPSFALESMTIRENLVGTQASPLLALTDIVAFLLLIATVNVATLLLARSVGRRKEFAIRAALGAGRMRHLRQLLVESLLLSATGCGAGLLIAAWLMPLTARLIPSVLGGQLGLWVPATDWRVALFAVLTSMASGVVAGVVPAVATWRPDPQMALSDGGRTVTAGRRGRRLLAGLIVAETALTLALLGGAGLVIRHFVALQTRHLGFEPRGLLVVSATPPESGYPSGIERAQLVARLVEELRTTPGVARAAATTVNPLGGGTWSASMTSQEMAARDANEAISVNYRLITPGLLETMGVPLVGGRSISEQDRSGSQPVAIVSRRMARRLWGDTNPIGRRVRLARPGAPWLQVVGVAGDVDDAHDPGVPLETCYLSFAQNAASSAAESFYLMVRTRGEPLDVLPAVRQAAARVDRNLPLYDPSAMDRYRAESLSRERVSALFMFAFAGFGLLLATLGVYAVIAFGVSQRTTEIGIRMALGARPGDLVPLLLARSARLVAVGLLVGTGISIALGRAIVERLPGMTPIDGLTLGLAALVMALTAALASLVPALRASRLPPLRALSG
jgi:putative ABC transport system permease protein